MNRLSQLSTRFIANRSLNWSSFPKKSECFAIRSFRSEFVLTTRCYSTKKGRKSASSRAEPEVTVMEQDKKAFYVVRKGDVVGVYNTLAESQAQLGPSVCSPPVSVYKGYSLSKDTEEYLVSHGLKNALYTIRAADLKEDLFGMLVPCHFQKVSEDPLRKQVKLDHVAVAEAPSLATRTCIVEFDGASKGNPGKAGAGAILRASDGSLICRLREGLGTATNNAAEYSAVILGMKYALEKGFTGIHIKGDSKLVCMQIDGSWKVKNENLASLYNVAKVLKNKFSSFQISHVLRNFNSDADAQANLAVDLAFGQVEEENV